MTMPAGKYWVGDLCYVLHEAWDECCDLFFLNRKDGGCNEGEFQLKDGRRFVSINTAYGDGSYYDQFGQRYTVDAGLIGCILLNDIDLGTSDNYFNGGNIIDFPSDFDCTYDHGLINIGHIRIETDPEYEDEEEYQ